MQPVPSPHSLQSKLDAALARRAPILRDKSIEAIRLFHGRADGIEGLVIEKWGPVLIVQIHEGHPVPSPELLRPHLLEWRNGLHARAVYLKQFVRDRAHATPELRESHQNSAPWIGEPAAEEFPVREYDLNFLIRPFDGYSVGLFLEHRNNRRRVAEFSRGRRVLNTFAYACGFSIAAAKGGATSVASVDLSRRYLEWGKRNFEANQLPIDSHRFYASDIFEFFNRARRQKLRYDMLILDPPTFSRTRRPPSVFELRTQLPRLVRESINLLDSGGILFLATNDRQIRREDLESALQTAAPSRRLTQLDTPTLPPDFTGDPQYSKSIFVRVN